MLGENKKPVSNKIHQNELGAKKRGIRGIN